MFLTDTSGTLSILEDWYLVQSKPQVGGSQNLSGFQSMHKSVRIRLVTQVPGYKLPDSGIQHGKQAEQMCPLLGHRADAMEKVCEEDFCNPCWIPLRTRQEECWASRAAFGLGKVTSRSKISLQSRLKLGSLKHPALREPLRQHHHRGPWCTFTERGLRGLRWARPAAANALW